uniref:ARS binding protein 1 putative n=1 Tax=Albugo laibachii Nc14 TaxID=890382 RepID=F0WQP1_9STRA|nr:ARS binding protein 1 putative [Albugo laibachii Nc14]|eukprot:CCA23650.1 ARS binding protein 1 putative [Albugo laibachii Nc14]
MYTSKRRTLGYEAGMGSDANSLTFSNRRARMKKGGNGNLTNYQRKLICEFYLRTGGVMSQKDLAQWTKQEFGLKKTPAQSTISGILRRQHEYINMSVQELNIKKRRVVQHPQLDEALANWVIQCAHRGIVVQGDMTKEKGKYFAQLLHIPEEEQPEFSNGWLHSFQVRHNFSFRKFHNYAHSRETRKFLTFTTREALLEETGKFEVHNIFCVHETVFLYRRSPIASPSCHIANGYEESPKSQEKFVKRIVVTLACNANASERLQPLYISHHQQPKCFRNKTPEEQSFQYFANPRAWMTGVIFSRWIERLDSAMASQRRKILLFLDVATSHVVAHLELTNIVVFFLPETVNELPESSALIDSKAALNLHSTSAAEDWNQHFSNPLGQSTLLHALKKRYRLLEVKHACQRKKNGVVKYHNVHVMHAMQWISLTWQELSRDVIMQAWNASELVPHRLDMQPELVTQNMTRQDDLFEAEWTSYMIELRIDPTSRVQDHLDDQMHIKYPIHEDTFDTVVTTESISDNEIDEEDTTVTDDTTPRIRDRTPTMPLLQRVHMEAQRSNRRQHSFLTNHASVMRSHENHPSSLIAASSAQYNPVDLHGMSSAPMEMPTNGYVDLAAHHAMHSFHAQMQMQHFHHMQREMGNSMMIQGMPPQHSPSQNQMHVLHDDGRELV